MLIKINGNFNFSVVVIMLAGKASRVTSMGWVLTQLISVLYMISNVNGINVN